MTELVEALGTLLSADLPRRPRQVRSAQGRKGREFISDISVREWAKSWSVADPQRS